MADFNPQGIVCGRCKAVKLTRYNLSRRLSDRTLEEIEKQGFIYSLVWEIMCKDCAGEGSNKT